MFAHNQSMSPTPTGLFVAWVRPHPQQYTRVRVDPAAQGWTRSSLLPRELPINVSASVFPCVHVSPTSRNFKNVLKDDFV